MSGPACEYTYTQSAASDAKPAAPDGHGWRMVFAFVVPALSRQVRIAGWARRAPDDYRDWKGSEGNPPKTKAGR